MQFWFIYIDKQKKRYVTVSRGQKKVKDNGFLPFA